MTAQDTINKQVLVLSTKLSVENQIKEIQDLLKRIQKNKVKILKEMSSRTNSKANSFEN